MNTLEFITGMHVSGSLLYMSLETTVQQKLRVKKGPKCYTATRRPLFGNTTFSRLCQQTFIPYNHCKAG